MDPDVSFPEEVTPVNEEVATAAALVETEAPVTPTARASKSLAHRAVHSSMWMFVGYGSSQAIRFGANIILARLLFPRAFGLMALINVLIQGLQMFSDLGIGPSIIKHGRTDDEKFFNTAWTIQVIRGVMLWLAAYALAGPVARFYEAPMLASMIPVAGLAALIGGFTSTKVFIHGRELKLVRVVRNEIFSQVVAVSVMILLAKYWGSAWSLVLGGVVGVFVGTVMSHVSLPGMRNRFYWDRQSARELFHFGSWIFVSTLFGFLAMQIDRLLLGRFISMETLGVYSIALGVVMIAVGVFDQFTAKILLPVLAQVRRQSEPRFVEALRQSRWLVLSIAAVVVTDLILLAPTVFNWLYDPRYRAAGWMAQLLGLGVWFTLLQRTSRAGLLAAGSSRSLAISNGINFVVTIITAPIGFSLGGIPGFIGCWTLGNFAGAVITDIELVRIWPALRRQSVALTINFALILTFGYLLLSLVRAFVGESILSGIEGIVSAAVISATAAISIWKRTDALRVAASNASYDR